MSTRDHSCTASVAYAREKRRITAAFIIIGCSMTASCIFMYSMCMTFGSSTAASMGVGFTSSIALGLVMFALYAADAERSRDRTSACKC